ncbi:MAG TPA: 23S rRNA (pseudouridine(1915)-N(3))-methyltransferase RlmH [Acetobacteraceae bacterium]|nr:23S rRNA (pseudouridine(1915)-N(3))-methyltransferase RlmH [Acetobacteraceae bacterium]
MRRSATDRGAPPGGQGPLAILAVGRLRSGPEADLLARYAERLRLHIAEIPDGVGAPAEIKRREGEALLAAVPRDGFVVALDQGGAAPGSEAFAALLEDWLAAGKKPVFVIGGAEGLSAAVVARAGYILSLGQFTWPHMLARVMLAEQLYRARMIAAGHPYHRAGRPDRLG